MSTKLLLGFGTLFLLAACSSGPVTAPSESTDDVHHQSLAQLVSPNNLPAWFQTAATSEAPIEQTSPLAIPQLNVEADILGSIESTDTADGVWYYLVDIGSTTPMECYSLTEFDGPANSLYAVMNGSVEATVERNAKPLAGSVNYALGNGMIGHVPYLHYEQLYSLGDGSQKVLGVVKGLSAQTDKSLQICVHNELGYRETFFSAFASFVRAFSAQDPRDAFFESIYRLYVNDVSMGISRERFTLDADGDIFIQVTNALLLPVDAANVSRTDSVSIAWSVPDGSLINTSVYSIENSSLASELELGRSEDKWMVNGIIQGKPISVNLEYDDWLLTEYGVYLETAAALDTGEPAGELHLWLPENPTATTRVRIDPVQDNPDTNVVVEVGPVVVNMLAKANGVMIKGVMQQGPLTLNMEPIYVRGEPVFTGQ